MSRRLIAAVLRSTALTLLILSSCQCEDPASTPEPAPDMGEADMACPVGAQCPQDPCQALGCSAPRGRCEVVDGQAVCLCDVGTIERAGQCVVDPCQPDPCAGLPLSVCQVVQDQSLCVCAPGAHEEGGVCVMDTTCQPTTCHEHGVCTQAQGGVMCACDAGFAGQFCERCDEASGFFDDGQGGCTQDPCAALSCSADRRCVIVDDVPSCVCAAGTHEEGGSCVMDVTCQANSCGGHGQCVEVGGQVECRCEPGWAQPSCGSCDAASGYHPDGQGGCTQDPCLPNPCGEANKMTCQANSDMAVCLCDAGYHLNGADVCVVDEQCQPTSCSGHGQCDDSTKEVVCACAAGYTGPSCASCDVAAGYHDDGQGGCTLDPCLPNPCGQPNKTSCQSAANMNGFVCSCDAGYHPDGQGGCTQDPCLPDLCAAQNQACRVNNGQAQCYTPTCDDLNPCTDDAVVSGQCVHTPRADGSSCATDVCVVNQSCQQGQCVGGAARDCDDLNPCTDDACVIAQGGCVSTPDDQNVPDDGIACTEDVCMGGIATHSPQDVRCDDGLYCSGQELCRPLDASADAAGCIVTNIPQPPQSSSPCQLIGACDEQTQSFPLVPAAVGMTCDDGIACTTNDACDAQGRCLGTFLASCPDATCTTTQPLGALDVPIARITPVVTYDGQDPNVLRPGGSFTIYGINKETGTWHSIAYYSSGFGGDKLIEGERLMPGVYDILYSGGSFSTANRVITYGYNTGSDVTTGMQYLQRDLVITRGQNVMSFNVPIARITPVVTYDGQDPNVLRPGGSFTIYGVHKETGTWHSIAYYSSGFGGDKLIEGERLMPGEYDILYSGGSFSTSNRVITYGYNTGSDVTTGMQYLQRNVMITAAGMNTLTINVPIARITPVVTYDGQDPNVLRPGGSFTIYGINKETGTWHSIAYYSSGFGGDKLIEGERLMPGEYDILYSGGSFSTSNRVITYGYNTGSDVTTGMQYLQRNVTINAAGPNNLSFNVPIARITPTVTYDGQDPNVLRPGGSFTIYGINKETGTWHSIAYYSSGFGGDKLIEGERLMPGEYDILYSGGSFSTANRVITYGYNTGSDVTTGMQYLQRNVTINATGTNVMSFNVPIARITPVVTYDGQDPNVLRPGGSFTIYGVHKETGTWHSIAYYSSGFGGDKLIEGERLMPGVYDILYSGGSFSTSNRVITYGYNTGSDVTTGMQYLQRNVTINAAGMNTPTINVPIARITPVVTYDGQDPNVLRPGGSFTIYGVHKETGTWHSIAYYSSGFGGDKLIEGERLMPGEYDILYSGGSFSTANRVITYGYNTGSDVTTGMQYLNLCVAIP